MYKYLILLLMPIFFQCAKTSYYLKDVDKNIRMSEIPKEEGYVLKKRFESSVTRHHFFWGLVAVEKDMESIINEELLLTKDKAIGNLKIKETYTFVNSLIEFFLIGLYRPYTTIISGGLYVKVAEPEAPIAPTESKDSIKK